MKYEYIAVDLQNDFASSGGRHYQERPSVRFLQETVFPYFQEHGIQINEIISDYRAPRPGYSGKGCAPGTWGYESVVPKELVKSRWIKSQNSPLWTRANAGVPDKEPGPPVQEVESFTKWLENSIGIPTESIPVVFGLTVECCVLSTLQELRWRGYAPLVLKEGVDHYGGQTDAKENVFELLKDTHWGKTIVWEELLKQTHPE